MEWISVKERMPRKSTVVDVWLSTKVRIPDVRYEWNGGSEGFWDWHYAAEDSRYEGEPFQMYDLVVTHWMSRPKAPKRAQGRP